MNVSLNHEKFLPFSGASLQFGANLDDFEPAIDCEVATSGKEKPKGGRY